MNPTQVMHAYEKLSLFSTGIVLALFLIGLHLLMLLKKEAAQAFLIKLPRNQQLGQILLGVGMIWFWLLVAKPGDGLFNQLAMNLGEFDKLKPILKLAVPIALVLVALAVKEFLAVRALGLLGLMVAAPLLQAAFLEDPATRLLIPIYAYAVIISSLYMVGMPYLFRDAVTWATASTSRWKGLCYAGLGYGGTVLICALLFWRGH